MTINQLASIFTSKKTKEIDSLLAKHDELCEEALCALEHNGHKFVGDLKKKLDFPEKIR